MFKTKRKVKEPDSFEHAYNYALFLLNLHLRTEGELRNKMTERGYVSKVIDAVLEQLLTERFVDDERYTEMYLENLKKYKDYGFYMIKKKLTERRLPKELIERKLTELVTVEDELIIAKRLLKKIVTVNKNFDQDGRPKLYHKMQARGFRTEAIIASTKSILK